MFRRDLVRHLLQLSVFGIQACAWQRLAYVTQLLKSILLSCHAESLSIFAHIAYLSSEHFRHCCPSCAMLCMNKCVLGSQQIQE